MKYRDADTYVQTYVRRYVRTYVSVNVFRRRGRFGQREVSNSPLRRRNIRMEGQVAHAGRYSLHVAAASRADAIAKAAQPYVESPHGPPRPPAPPPLSPPSYSRPTWWGGRRLESSMTAFSCDGIHLTDEGHVIVSRAVQAALGNSNILSLSPRFPLPS